MSALSRRQFLRLAGGAAASAALPLSIQRALAIPANNKTGTIMDVEHVVILMQENRSFDHYFGTLPGVRGFGDRFTIPLPGGRTVWEQQFLTEMPIPLSLPGPAQNPTPRAEPDHDRIVMPYHLDQTAGNAQRVTGTPHSFDNAQAAWDKGRLHQWPTYKRTWSMGYFTEAELEFQWAMANAFTLCDSYHCSFHGGTNPNRLFHWTGTNDPYGKGGGPALNNNFASLGASTENCYTWKTFPERLEEAGVSWKVYQNHPINFSDNPLEGFRQYRQANEKHGNTASGFPWPPYVAAIDDLDNPLYKGAANTLPDYLLLTALKDDVANDRLPQVSWVIAPDAWSEHPDPSSPVQGAWYTQQVLDALTSNPEVWSKTVFIVNFDENDGFFDHVPPPCAPSRNVDGSLAGKSTIDIVGETHEGQPFPGGIYGPGPRVPLYAISPWSKGGWVCSETFDHTSVLRFLETRFGVTEGNISPWRRAVCGDLTSAFNFATPNEAVEVLPHQNFFAATATVRQQESQDQVPLPDENAQMPPQQPVLVRQSRALPYELHASAYADPAGRVRIGFANTGTAMAVFHVYDKLHLDRVPRRYGVEPGKALEDVWDTNGDNGAYDLWVLGPNSWHRHFTGSTAALARSDAANPDIQVCYDVANGDVYLKMRNNGFSACTLSIADNAYGLGGPWTFQIAPGQTVQHAWNLSASHRWYDFTATMQRDAGGFARRYAGRVETGKPGISDPAG